MSVPILPQIWHLLLGESVREGLMRVGRGGVSEKCTREVGPDLLAPAVACAAATVGSGVTTHI